MPDNDERLCFYVPGKPGIIDLVINRDGQTVGMYSGETLEQVARRYPGAQLAPLDRVHAESCAMFRSPPVEITEEKFQEMLEVLPPKGWVNHGRTETFKLAEHTYGPITAIFCRIGEKYYTLKDDSSTPHDTIVAMVTAVAQPDPAPTNTALELIYRHTPPEYRSVIDGKKFIPVLRTGEGTCLVTLTGLTDAEIADKLPYAVKAEARQLGKDAHARRLGAAPVLDKRCMDLVRDLNPSGEIGAGHTSIILEKWLNGWHAANAATSPSYEPYK
jgi:Protein of unknown function (DUF1419)